MRAGDVSGVRKHEESLTKGSSRKYVKLEVLVASLCITSSYESNPLLFTSCMRANKIFP